MTAGHYKLKCQFCGAECDDDGVMLDCTTEHEPALLVTEYTSKRFECDWHAEGIYRYRNWLPICRVLSNVGRTITYQSERLSRITGLPRLWIAFNGYWPEKGAMLATATFKELESYTVLSRVPERHEGILVVASAGNTAAAFAQVCSRLHFPCLIVIPESGLQRMQFIEPLDPCVKVVSLTGFVDYYDAIVLANRISKREGFFPEGGVKNIARRDGLGTTLLSAVETIGQLPDYYFQAIGSGAGGIAVHEVAKRLVNDGRFGQRSPRLMLSQNFPFVPIYLSWKAKRREMISIDRNEGKKQIQQVAAHVLSNQHPPFSIKGGVFDALNESQGDMLFADNVETLYAVNLFQEAEGIDIDPASGVAFATLIKAASNGQIDRETLVLLNITGGGWERKRLENRLISVRPDLRIDECELASEETLEEVIGLFR